MNEKNIYTYVYNRNVDTIGVNDKLIFVVHLCVETPTVLLIRTIWWKTHRRCRALARRHRDSCNDYAAFKRASLFLRKTYTIYCELNAYHQASNDTKLEDALTRVIDRRRRQAQLTTNDNKLSTGRDSF